MKIRTKPHVIVTAVVTAFALAGGAAAASASPGGDAAAQDSKGPAPRVLGTFNMAGATNGMESSDEDVPRQNKGKLGIANDVISAVKDRNPSFVALQEVCGRQAKHMDSKLKSRGYNVRFTADATDEGRCTGPGNSNKNASYLRESGGAIIYKTDVFSRVSKGKEKKLHDNRLRCVEGDNPKVAACSVHLPKGDSEATRRIRDNMNDFFPNKYQIIAGDFNNKPLEAPLDNIYHRKYVASSGAFDEVASSCRNSGRHAPLARGACRNGEPTQRTKSGNERKIDYIFVSPQIKVDWADATSAAKSDHHPLWAKVHF